MNIGDRIKDLRIEKGISQIQLADEINVSKQTLFKYENGIVRNIPSDKIELLAKVLGTTPAYLMGWDDPKEWKPTISNKDRRDIAKEVESIIAGLNYSSALSFDGSDEIDDTTRELLKKSLENTLETARLIAKEKYTPQKYRK